MATKNRVIFLEEVANRERDNAEAQAEYMKVGFKFIIVKGIAFNVLIVSCYKKHLKDFVSSDCIFLLFTLQFLINVLPLITNIW